MNRIETTFKHLKERSEKALVGFVSAGDPNIAESGRIIKAMCKSGLDILELGIPFSDPTADGPVIQRSSGRALAGGMTLKIALDMTRDIRQTTDIPIILFSYYNPIHAYGNRKFYTDAVNAGADGVLIVDLPPEESDEMTNAWAGKDLSLIRLIAPTTPKERMKQIADSASGFLYLVSKTGVTGSAGLNTSEVGTHVATLRSVSNLPICVGFGISTADDVKAVAKTADGVVIGSAYEKLIEENLTHHDLPGLLAERTMVYKAATKV